MAWKQLSLINLLFGTMLGAGVSLTGVYFNLINLETNKNRFSLEFFTKYQNVMAEEDLTLRAEWLQRLKRVHEDEPLVVINAAIELTAQEIAAEIELEQVRKLEEEAKEAERVLVKAREDEQQAEVAAMKAEAEAVRIAAEIEAKRKAEIAAAAALKAQATTRQILIDSIHLGYDKSGQRVVIP